MTMNQLKIYKQFFILLISCLGLYARIVEESLLSEYTNDRVTKTKCRIFLIIFYFT